MASLALTVARKIWRSVTPVRPKGPGCPPTWCRALPLSGSNYNDTRESRPRAVSLMLCVVLARHLKQRDNMIGVRRGPKLLHVERWEIARGELIGLYVEAIKADPDTHSVRIGLYSSLVTRKEAHACARSRVRYRRNALSRS